MVALQLSAVASILSELLRLEPLESRRQGLRVLPPEAVPRVLQRLLQSPAGWPLPEQLLLA